MNLVAITQHFRPGCCHFWLWRSHQAFLYRQIPFAKIPSAQWPVEMDASVHVSTPFVALLLVLGIILYHFVVRPAFVSPLAKVPSAHWSCTFSPFWILRRRFLDDELLHLFQIHKRLGPVIRVAPKEISVSSIGEGIRKIYDGGFDKPGYYKFFDYYELVTQ